MPRRRPVSGYVRRKNRQVRQTRRAYRRSRPVSKRYARNLVSKANEKKSFDSMVLNAGAISTAATITDLTPIPQGDTDGSRDGDQLMLKSIQFRLMILAGPVIYTSSPFVITVRHIIIQWFPPTTPTLANVLDTTTLLAIYAPYEHASSQKMRVLYDRVHHLIPQTIDANPLVLYLNAPDKSTVYQRKLITKIPRRLQQYDSGATTGTSKLYNIIFASNATPAIGTLGVRVNFTDI